MLYLFRAIGLCVVSLSAACVSGSNASPPAQDKLIRLSMIQLLAWPERYEGKEIEVQGFLYLGDEERALYLSRDDAESLNTLSSVWLDKVSVPKAHATYVVVHGTFTARRHGHMGLWPGEIHSIAAIDPVISRRR